MSAASLYDLSPLGGVMLIGSMLALGLLLWLYWRNPTAKRLQALTLLTLFLTFDLLLFGAFTRLTDSGLGCPDWPGCYGQSSPLAAGTQISAAQTLLPGGPVTHGKAWIEMLHRYAATALGALIIVLAVFQWRGHRQAATRALTRPCLAVATLAWVAAQGAFGALTVTWKLFPAIVTLHLLGGIMLLLLLLLQVVPFALAGRERAVVADGTRRWLWLTLVLVALQVALGGWVSTNYAVLACRAFPQCQGSWWPAMDFAQGFSVWRELGLTREGQFLDFEALTAVHYTHRLFAYPVLLALIWLVWQLWRSPARLLAVRWLALLLALQWITGVSNVLLDWPLLSALLHSGGGAALVLALVWMLSVSRSASAAAGA